MTSQQDDSLSEQRLVEKCRQNDAEAFSAIVDAYQGRVYGFVRRLLRNDEESLDVTQEVFIRAFQAVGRFDGRSSLRTWLFKIAYNLCIDRTRRLTRNPAAVSLEAHGEGEEAREIPDQNWNPEQVLMNQEFMEILEQGLEKMSEKLRSVLLLHDKEDLGYDEIALAMNIPVGTVKSRLFLARSQLQECVLRYRSTENLSI